MEENFKNRSMVYALGETVLDLVSEGNYSLHAVPGGSVLNASVSLSRMRIDVQLISESGDDRAGDLIEEFLKINAVKTDYFIRNSQHKTSLALAFLDKQKKASYSFYHDYPEQLTAQEIPDFRNEDILLFGSYYSAKPDRRNFILAMLKKAIENKSLVYYDLNIRKNHSADMAELMASYMNNIAAATIVKGSDEDFMSLFGLSDPEEVYKKIFPYCKILIITSGDKPLRVFTPSYSRSYNIPAITPVSTIGAGDNFNAGFIYGLATTNHGIRLNPATDLKEADMDRMIACGIAFATETCLSADNYISGNFEPEFWKKYI